MAGLAQLSLFCVCLSLSVGERTIFDITQYGAKGDNKTINTAAIQATIDAAGKVGGVVVVPEGGAFVSGALWLRSNIKLEVKKGAVLRGAFTGWHKTYDVYPNVYMRANGKMQYAHSGLINGGKCIKLGGNYTNECTQWDKLSNIEIAGHGEINGNGQPWWKDCPDNGRCPDGCIMADQRPILLSLFHIENLHIHDVQVKDSPFWQIHVAFCNNVTINNIHSTADPTSPNTDAFHADSSTNVHVTNCLADVGDDCYVVSSGKGISGRTMNVASANITFENSVCLHGHGLSCGSGTSGGIHNITFKHMFMNGTRWGTRVKSMRGRGGLVSQVLYDNVTMHNIVEQGIRVSMYYHTPTPPPTNKSATPKFRNLNWRRIRGYNLADIGYFRGLPESHIEDVSLEDVHLQGVKHKDWYQCQNAYGEYSGTSPSLIGCIHRA